MKKRILFSLLFYFIISAAYTQSVSISTSGVDGDASSMLDVISTDKGVLIPRIALTETSSASPISSPATSLVVYNTATVNDVTPGFYYWDGSEWLRFFIGNEKDVWGTSGNSSLASGTYFIGTTDAQDLDFRTNNSIKLRLSTKGQLETLNTGFSTFIGEGAGENDDLTNNNNVFIGKNSGNTNTSGFFNSFIGNSSGFSNTTGSWNTGAGYQSLFSNTTGQNNVSIGFQSMLNNTTASNNVAIGDNSLETQSYNNSNTVWSSNNTAIGSNTLNKNQPTSTSTGINNTAIGYSALYANTTGKSNTATGYQSMTSNTTSDYNSAYGYWSLRSNTEGEGNTSIGSQSMYDNTKGDYNIAIGYQSAYNNLEADYNIALGYQSMFSNEYANNNISIGYQALRTMSFTNSGTNFDSDNIAIGNGALYSNQPTSTANGKSNIAVGSNSLRGNSTGTGNLAIGNGASYFNTNGNNNISLGNTSMYYARNTCTNNVAIGISPMYGTSLYDGATYNVALGYIPLYRITSGDFNLAIGNNSLDDITTGNGNIAFGSYAGSNLNSGTTYSTFIGYSSNAIDNTTAYNYSVAIGFQAIISDSQQVRIGNSSTYSATSIGGPVAWTNTSDGRFKVNVQENVPGIEFITKLRPVTYNFDQEKLNDFNNIPDSCRNRESSTRDLSIIRTGFIAQEVEKAAKECNYEFSGVDAPKNDSDIYGLRYAEFVVPLVKATQEQQIIIEDLQNDIIELKKLIDIQQKQIEKLMRE